MIENAAFEKGLSLCWAHSRGIVQYMLPSFLLFSPVMSSHFSTSVEGSGSLLLFCKVGGAQNAPAVRWSWLIKWRRFQAYGSIIRHLHIALCDHHLKSPLPSAFIDPLSPSLPSPQTLCRPWNWCLPVSFCFYGSFISCSQFSIHIWVNSYGRQVFQAYLT